MVYPSDEVNTTLVIDLLWWWAFHSSRAPVVLLHAGGRSSLETVKTLVHMASVINHLNQSQHLVKLGPGNEHLRFSGQKVQSRDDHNFSSSRVRAGIGSQCLDQLRRSTLLSVTRILRQLLTCAGGIRNPMLLGSRCFSAARNCAGTASLILATPVRCFGGSAIMPGLLKGSIVDRTKDRTSRDACEVRRLQGPPSPRSFLEKNAPRATSTSPHNSD